VTQSPPSPKPRVPRLTSLEASILVLFFFSGASALIYEVVWVRQLTNVFGGSAFAIATVLAAFMAGLALGSTLLGRFIDRRGHPLVVYGVLEAGIAVWALALPALLGALDRLYVGIYQGAHPGFHTLSLIRFILSFLVLLPPTTLMGGTLPVLGKLLLRERAGLGVRAGILYGINTLGAVLGTFAAGFFLLPLLGMRGTTWTAVCVNLGVALLAVGLSRRIPIAAVSVPPEQLPAPSSPGTSPRLRRAVLAVYAASGFAALAYEVAWTKTLSMILGTTNYAFTSMLATFLLGLALGSLLFGRLADRSRRVEALLAEVQLLIPLFALLTIPILEKLPQLFVDAFPHLHTWAAQEGYRILLAASTLFLPAVLMGGTFPLVTRVYVGDRSNTGRDLGVLYAANTVGAILGSFLAGFVLIPALGRQNTILAATLVNVAAAVFLLVSVSWRRVPGPYRWATTAAAVLLVPAVSIGLRPWNPRIMASGAYLYAPLMKPGTSIEEGLEGSNLFFYEESTEATISLWQSDAVTSLRTNGKVEASSHGDMATQRLISHLPLFYHSGEPRRALMIGLASGISVGSLLTHPLDHVDTVELMPSMLHAARYFDAYNHNCLDDPRLDVILNDGRNELLLTDKKYDVIVSEPSNPWIAGVGSLFTREFFELTKSRLAPGGVVCQWVQTYQFRDEDLRTILATFRDAYPYLHMWEGAAGDLILVGSEEPLVLDLDRVRAELQGPPGEDLAEVEILPLPQLLGYFVTDRDGISEWVGDWPRRVTDDNLYLEYAIPRHMFEKGVAVNVLTFLGVHKPVEGILKPGQADSTLVAGIARYRRAHETALRAFFHQPAPGQPQDPEQLAALAYSEAPDELVARSVYSRHVNDEAIEAFLADNKPEALEIFRKVSEIGNREERALALNNMGAIYYEASDWDSARVTWEACLAEEPNFPIVNYNLALLLAKQGEHDRAIDLLRRAIIYEPENAGSRNNLAYYLALEDKDLDEAEQQARRAVALDPDPNIRDTLGFVLLKRGEWPEAARILDSVVQENPSAMETWLRLGMARAGEGKRDQARAAFETVIRESNDEELTRQAREEMNRL